MGLTKHEKLARAIKQTFDRLDRFYEKNAKHLDVLQFHFFETHLCIGRPLMTEGTLRTMMYAHKIGLKHLTQDEELRAACATKPLVGFIVTPPFYLPSRSLVSPPGTPDNYKWVIPWGVKMHLPSKTLKSLDDAKLEAILYCPSEDEMPEWIDWFEKEDKANTYTNQLLSVGAYFENQDIVMLNRRKLALSFFEETASNFYGKNEYLKKNKALRNAIFIPTQETSLGQAYDQVILSLIRRTERHHDDLKRVWKSRLEELILEGVEWSKTEKENYFNESKSLIKEKFITPDDDQPQDEKSIEELENEQKRSRWKTSLVVDRQTYGSFIKYFADRFLENSSSNKAMGEIALLLWIMIHIAQDPEQICRIKELLELKTSNLRDGVLHISGNKTIELSAGLWELLDEYSGSKCLGKEKRFHSHRVRKIKLFPGLTIDSLEDAFHRASREVLPDDSLHALPEAFLTFPHSIKHMRMSAELRKHRQLNPGKIYHDPISRQKLQQQLVKKSVNP